MDNLRKFCIRGVNSLFILLFGGMWIINFRIYSSRNIFFLPGFFLTLCIGFVVYNRFMKRDMEEGISKSYIWALLVIMLVLLFLSGWKLRCVPGSDWGAVYNGAVELATFDEFHTEWFKTYFNRYPNNILWLLMNAGLYKVMTFFHLYRYYEASILINIGSLFLCIVLMMKMAKKSWGHKGRLAMVWLLLVCVPYYLYAPTFYTDVPSLVCVVCTLVLLQMCSEKRCEKKGDICRLIAAGVFMGIGFNLKGTLVVMIIAVVMWQMLRNEWKKVLWIAIGLLGSIFIVNSLVQNSGIIQEEYMERQKIPYTHWIMMGLKGSGTYNTEDVEYTLSFDTYQEKIENNVVVIEKRLKEYGALGVVEHLYKKVINGIWEQGDFGSTHFSYSETMHWGRAQELFWRDGKYYDKMIWVIREISMFYLALNVLSGILVWKSVNADFAFLLRLMLLGLLCFLMIWEAASRYFFGFIPCILLLSVSAGISIQDIAHKV